MTMEDGEGYFGKFSHNASGGGLDNPSESPFGDPPPFTQGRLSPSVLAFARTAPSSEGANEALRYYTGLRCVEVSVANGTPAPRNEILPKISRCPEDSLWLQPAGTLRSVSGAPVPCGVTCAAVRR